MKSLFVRLFCCLALLCPVLAGCRSEPPELILTYSPPEAILSIDGYSPEKSSSPHRFTFFKDGRYRLRVEAVGYNPVEMFVEVRSDKRQTLAVHLIPTGELPPPPEPLAAPPSPPPPPAPPAISTDSSEGHICRTTIESVPAGAVVLAGSATGGPLQSAGPTPTEIVLSPDHPTRLELSMNGFDTVRRLIPPSSATCPGVLRIEMVPSVKGIPVSSPSPLVQPDPPPLPDPIISDVDDSATVGLLSVTTEPWTIVHVDGVSVGTTPVRGIRLPAGTHTVIMENRDLGKRRVKKINIHPGDHVRLAEEL